MTGMIIAALYVIMLVGFSRESYMRRDYERRTATQPAATAVDAAVCRAGPPRCDSLLLEGR